LSSTPRRSLLARFGEEVDGLKAALAAAPEPELHWDFLGGRRTLHRVWWALKNEHASPPRMAAAVFLGVLIGCSPFYGFHVVLCLLLAFVFRLNKLVVWLGSNVSLPIFAPFLAFASIQCAHLLLHGELADVSVAGLRESGPVELVCYWMVGFLPVGSVLGVVTALLVLWRMQPEEAETP